MLDGWPGGERAGAAMRRKAHPQTTFQRIANLGASATRHSPLSWSIHASISATPSACVRLRPVSGIIAPGSVIAMRCDRRSEEHTSELQSLMRNSYAVFGWNKKKAEHNT